MRQTKRCLLLVSQPALTVSHKMEWNTSSPRDSRRLPRYTRVELPKGVDTVSLSAHPVVTSMNKTLHTAFPSEEWRTDYMQNFTSYRQNLRHALKTGYAPGEWPKVPLPNWQNREEWWKFITGSSSSEPREPTFSMLKQFSTRNTTGLLYWFSVWITDYADGLEEGSSGGSGKDENVRGEDREDGDAVVERRIDSVHQHWMFALLGLLDPDLVGGDISTLRVLARAAIRLVQLVTDEHKEEKVAPGTIAGCWMVVAAIVGVWGQRDIWDEAREALSR